ncbi:DJ-1 family glyoxalase III [Sulfurimonas sp.]|uniref:DJ-1 family glyoxalase III n=1 Tax=Sulfurimonas sp. TaxID=2022749 RepID=UPI003D0DF06D
MSKVLVPLACGFEEIEAVTIIDVLRRAEIEVLIGSITGDPYVEGAHKMFVQTDCIVERVTADMIDMIVLPGGWGGTLALAEDAYVQTLLKDMDAKGKEIGAICAAPFALHKAGVLKQNYTCYPEIENEIRLDGFVGDRVMVVEDGNVMTSRGPATAMCFALEIVKKLKGAEVYNSVKNGLLANYCGE